MARIINADDLLAEVAKVQALEPDKAVAKIIMLITETEGVDAVEVVHGRWEYYSTTMMECSNCKRHTARHKFKHCPHCGAVMEDKYNG